MQSRDAGYDALIFAQDRIKDHKVWAENEEIRELSEMLNCCICVLNLKHNQTESYCGGEYVLGERTKQSHKDMVTLHIMHQAQNHFDALLRDT